MEVLVENSCKCFGSILSLVQILFSFANTRIAKFSLAEKAALVSLVSQFFKCLHDNRKHIIVKSHTTKICACSHTLKGRWFNYLVYLNEFKTV